MIREEVVEVAEKPNTETFPLSSKEEGDQKNEVKTDNGDIHEQLKAQSIQLSSLAEMVESLQSQVNQLQETISLKHKKTSSVRKKSTGNIGTKTKKKTKRRGKASRKK
jgi:hypothetical protein